jgi:hypothetical protein
VARVTEHSPDRGNSIKEKQPEYFLHRFQIVYRRHVGVHFGQSRHQVFAGRFDHQGARACFDGTRVSDSGYLSVPYHHRLVFQYGFAIHRNYVHIPEYHFPLAVIGNLLSEGKGPAKANENNQQNGKRFHGLDDLKICLTGFILQR